MNTLITPEILDQMGFKNVYTYKDATNGLHRRSNGVVWFDYIDNEPVKVSLYAEKAHRYKAKMVYVHELTAWYEATVHEPINKK